MNRTPVKGRPAPGKAPVVPWIWRVKPGAPRGRATLLLVGLIVGAVVLSLRCVYVQGFDLAGNAVEALSPDAQLLPASRGTITDRNGQILAESVPAVTITANPTMVATNGMEPTTMDAADWMRAQAGAGIIAGVMAAYLNGDYQTYYNELTATTNESGEANQYVVLQRNVPTFTNLQVTRYLDALGYTGTFRENAPLRSYPNGTVAANTVGYMTFSDDLASQKKYPWTGGDGLEYALNASLTGVDGEAVSETSPFGKIPGGTSIVKAPRQGTSYQLTLDVGLQYMQDQRLAAAVIQAGARSGTAVTLDVKTGEVLAISTYPTFDPNNVADNANLGVRFVRETYEPGSVEKVLTMSALVDQGLAAADTRVIIPGTIPSGDSVIHDAWDHPTVHWTGAGVIANSSNIGMVLLTRQLDKATLADYLHRFGLGAPTGVGFSGEEAGSIPGADMSDQTRDNIAFGQGLSVTALQEAAAVNAIANGGMYVAPSLIKSATDTNGKVTTPPPPETHKVIAPETAAQVLAMMESVVELNTNSFDVAGYRTAGKSGTAEAPDPTCNCYRGSVVSYVGVAPAENPALLTYVVIDHPNGNQTGTSAAAPVVRDVMAVALPRYGIPTSTTSAPHLPVEW